MVIALSFKKVLPIRDVITFSYLFLIIGVIALSYDVIFKSKQIRPVTVNDLWEGEVAAAAAAEPTSRLSSPPEVDDLR